VPLWLIIVALKVTGTRVGGEHASEAANVSSSSVLLAPLERLGSHSSGRFGQPLLLFAFCRRLSSHDSACFLTKQK
jgi:hypothetical protein